MPIQRLRVASLLCVSLAWTTQITCSAQAANPPAAAARTPDAPRTAAGESSALARRHLPEGVIVHPDRTVTFRIDEPSATQVAVNIEGQPKPLPLQRDRDGLWTLTTPPMEPEEYEYSFDVDGARRVDPGNPHIRSSLFLASSILTVTGATPMPWELQNIPHGLVTRHIYQSKVLGDQRDLYVYTPPGYDAKRATPYPVLYLLHGYSDDATAWVQKAEANYILDTLIGSGKLEPTVVVMPLAYGTLDMIRQGWTVWRPPYEVPLRNQRLLTDQLLQEVLPMAEANYHIARDPAHRAIAGLSMGGGESISTGLNHPEVFGYVGAFSSAIVSPLAGPSTPPSPELYAKAFAGIVPNAATQPPVRLFWLSCGTEDALITPNRAFGAWAKQNVKGNVIIGETPGMHTMLVWRQNLISFSQLLWK